jgi:hypothetical protein
MQTYTHGSDPNRLHLYTVATRSGVRLYAWATSSEEACSKVHGALGAWLGCEPFSPGRRS